MNPAYPPGAPDGSPIGTPPSSHPASDRLQAIGRDAPAGDDRSPTESAGDGPGPGEEAAKAAHGSDDNPPEKTPVTNDPEGGKAGSAEHGAGTAEHGTGTAEHGAGTAERASSPDPRTSSSPEVATSSTDAPLAEPEGEPSEGRALEEAPTVVKVIKRYSNRKLYDTDRSRYVTLDEIARMVKAGEHVCIIDNESKEDLTSVTLTQIIYEREKSSRSMPLEVLRNMIQTSGDTLNELLDRSVATATKGVGSSVSEIRQSALSIRDMAARQLSELTESARRFFSREERRAEEFRRAAWFHVDQLEARLEQRVRAVRSTRTAIEQHRARSDDDEAPSVDELLEKNTHSLEHVDALRTRLSALSVLVDRLEQAARGRDSDDEQV